MLLGALNLPKLQSSEKVRKKSVTIPFLLFRYLVHLFELSLFLALLHAIRVVTGNQELRVKGHPFVIPIISLLFLSPFHDSSFGSRCLPIHESSS